MNKYKEIIEICWSVDDVLQQCNWLTREQALEVLHELEYRHNPCIGINWDTINTVAEILYPQTQQSDNEEWS